MSEQPARTVAIFGAGIAGLSAAHELVRLGYQVRVFEADSEAGGFFRSARLPREGNMPTEYSWHGMGPWYHNVFDLFKQIPFDDSGSLYDKALSRPIDFGIFPERGSAQFYDRGMRNIPSMFAMSGVDFIPWAWLMLKTWCANRRTVEQYARLNAAAAWRRGLSERCHRTWRACFGPWVGSDWTVCSLHTAGQFFRKQLTSHRADGEGPAWNHGAGDGWLLLRGPSSEYWFDRWVSYLSATGVEFAWSDALHRLHFDGSRITGADLESGRSVRADLYVVAVDPFAAAEVFARTPSLENQAEVCRFRPLIQDGPHTQVSFRLAFPETVKFPSVTGHP